MKGRALAAIVLSILLAGALACKQKMAEPEVAVPEGEPEQALPQPELSSEPPAAFEPIKTEAAVPEGEPGTNTEPMAATEPMGTSVPEGEPNGEARH